MRDGTASEYPAVPVCASLLTVEAGMLTWTPDYLSPKNQIFLGLCVTFQILA